MSGKIQLSEMKRRAQYINPYLLILNQSTPKGTKEDPWICHCNKCNGTYNQVTRNINAGYYRKMHNISKSDWCPVCDNKIIIKGINDIGTLRPDLLKYFVDIEDGYTHSLNTNKKILCKCPNCKNEALVSMPYLISHGYRCKLCSDNISYPNRICRLLLNALPVEESKSEYIKSWTKGKRYDGYFKLNGQLFLLEFDGEQHFIDTSWDSKKKQEENDAFKTKLAEDNGYKLIRIDCKESTFSYIKHSIYQSELNELFDLDKINWDMLLQKSLKSKIFDVIDYYNNTDMTNKEIGEELDLDRHTVYRYLMKANELKLINYKSRKESKRIIETRVDTQRKNSDYRFELYDQNNILINEFSLISDCVNYLNKLNSNNHFTHGEIERALRNNTIYKGYYFKYTMFSKKTSYDINYICNYFIQHQYKSNTQISKELNIPRKSIEKSIYLGLSIGLIHIDDLTEEAFKKNRLSKYRKEVI